MIVDTGVNICVSNRLSGLLTLLAEEQRDPQDPDIIRAELCRKLARTAEDNPNSIEATVEQEFKQAFGDHLHNQIIETYSQHRSFGDCMLVHRNKRNPDGRTEAWTGHGSVNEGKEPKIRNCMKAFQAHPLKECQAMKPVKETCNEGVIEAKTQVCLKNEANASRICLCIRNMEEHLQDLGMEPTCDIIADNEEHINMLQEPGLLTEEIVDTWIEDLTTNGAWDPVTKTRLPMCQHDCENMMMSGKAMMNSCTEGLQLLLKEGLKPKDMNGPKIFFTILQRVHSASISKMHRLKEEPKALDLKKAPAKNVTVHCQSTMPLVREFKVNFMTRHQIPELTIIAHGGLRKYTCPSHGNKVNDRMMANDINTGGKAGNKKMDAIEMLMQAEDFCKDLLDQDDHSLANVRLPGSGWATVGQQRNVASTKGNSNSDTSSKP